MKYRRLGNSGTSVSNLTLGSHGLWNGNTGEGSVRNTRRLRRCRGQHHRHRRRLRKGASEELIGRWRSSRPDKAARLVVAAKARFGTGPDVNDAGSSRPHLDRALNTSLRRLGVDAIDLYQMHGWDPLTPVRKPCRFWTRPFALGRSITSACPTSRDGSSNSFSPRLAQWVCRFPTRCSSNTAVCAARSNTRSFRRRFTTISVSFHGCRWRQAS